MEKIFKKYYSPLCNYASKIIHDDFASEDIVQSLFIQLIEQKKWNSIKNIEAFLLRSVKYKCIDFLRKSKQGIEMDISDLGDEASYEQNEITEEDIEPLFYYYASKLPPKTREVFLLSRQNKMTYSEIAEELNISVKTVENQMGRALKKMKEMLKDNPVLLQFLISSL